MKSLPLLATLALIIQTLSADTAINSLGGTSPVIYVDAGSLSDPYYNFYFVEETGTLDGYIPLSLHSDGAMSLIVGETYIFKRLAGETAHPFLITDDSNGGSPSNKITIKAGAGGTFAPWPSGSGLSGGTLEMEVTINESFDPSVDSLFYICTAHSNMIGNLNVVTPANINTGSYGLGLKPNGLSSGGSYRPNWPTGSPWTTSLSLFDSEQAESANTHELKINVTSLGSSNNSYRLVRTNANGQPWYQNAQGLGLGLNTIPIPGVAFPRDIAIHFKTQEIGISSIELNGNTLAGFDPIPVQIAELTTDDVPSGSLLSDGSGADGILWQDMSGAGFIKKHIIFGAGMTEAESLQSQGGLTVTFYVSAISDTTRIRTVKKLANGEYHIMTNPIEITQELIDNAESSNGHKVELYVPAVNFSNRTLVLQLDRLIAYNNLTVESTSDLTDIADITSTLGTESQTTIGGDYSWTSTTNKDFPYSFEGVNMYSDIDSETPNPSSRGVVTFTLNVTALPYSGLITYDIIKSGEDGWAEAGEGDGTNVNQGGTITTTGEHTIKVAGTTYDRSVLLRVSAPFGYSSIVATTDANDVVAAEGSYTTFNDSGVFSPGTNAAHPYIYKLASSNNEDPEYSNNQEQKRIYLNVTALPVNGATYNISKSLQSLDEDGNTLYDTTQGGTLSLGMNAILLKEANYDRTAVLRISGNIAYDFFGKNSSELVGSRPILNIPNSPIINMVENETDSNLSDSKVTWNENTNVGFFLQKSTDLINWDYVSSGGTGVFREDSGSTAFYRLSD
jgi:hypothetical protein